MQEIEAKKKLKASEGAHFFYSLIFLSGSGIIEYDYIDQVCNRNLPLFIHLVFYGLVIWGTYILITIIPKYRNPAINFFFNFLDACFAIFILVVWIFGFLIYIYPESDCPDRSPVQYFFLKIFLLVTNYSDIFFKIFLGQRNYIRYFSVSILFIFIKKILQSPLEL